MLFDTHAHILDEQFAPDLPDVLNRIHDQMDLVVNVACEPADWQRDLDLLDEQPKIYGAAALHPNDAKLYTPELWENLRTVLRHPKMVAVGETGLDYYWDDATPEEQQALFIRHIELAKELGKPLIIHDRDAHQDTLDMLRSHGAQEVGGVLHAFSGSWEMAKLVLNLNFYIALGGPVTFKNASKPLEVARNVPLDRLLIETDCPYMAPVPMRGKRNEPIYTRYIAEKIAELRGISAEEVIEATCANGKQLFGIE